MIESILTALSCLSVVDRKRVFLRLFCQIGNAAIFLDKTNRFINYKRVNLSYDRVRTVDVMIYNDWICPSISFNLINLKPILNE